jgi:3-methyl-2-oxobutanoate hydroxymethyltransferase
MVNVQTFKKRKQQNRKISMVTCYDFWTAKIINQSDIDCILVGDSLAVVMHGFDSTVHATLDMMKMHVAAVVRGAPDKFVIADMPFLSCSKGIPAGMDAVQELMQTGASAVKIEGAAHQANPSIVSVDIKSKARQRLMR